MRKMVAVGVLLFGSTWVAGCGSRGDCGKGTYQDGRKCRPGEPGTPVVSVDPPPGRTRGLGEVRLAANEPATIYYTLDGTEPTTSSASEPDLVEIQGVDVFDTVKYFAVDREGNASAVETASWVLDVTGPVVPSLELTLSGTQRTVTWTRPSQSDLAGVVVARIVGRIAGPAPESVLAEGDEIAAGVQVVAVAEGEGSFTEDLAVDPGLVRYAAWGVDDLGNYGPAASDSELIPIPPQTVAFTASAATGAVSVTTAPSVHDVAGAATYDALSGELTIELSLTNGSTRMLFAPKLVVNSASMGVLENADGNLAGSSAPFGGPIPPPSTGSAFLSFGTVLPPALPSTREIVFSGIGPSDVVAIQATIADNPVIAGVAWDNLTGGGVADPEGGIFLGRLGAPDPKARGVGGEGAQKGGAITADGWMFTGARSAARVTRYDLVTRMPVGGTTLMDQKSSVQRLIADSAGGRLFALVMTGHRSKGGSDSWLVSLDAATLQEGERLPLGQSRNRDMKLSPDGRWLAIATGLDNILIVDVVDLRLHQEIKTTVAAFGGGAPPSPPGSVNSVTFSESGDVLYAVTDQGGVLEIDPQQGAVSPIGAIPQAVSSSDAKVFGTGIADDGRLWIGRNGDVNAFDLTTGTFDTFEISDDNFAVLGGRPYLGEGELYRLDADGNIDLSIALDDVSLQQHWLGSSPF